jgi:hypothetical protein
MFSLPKICVSGVSNRNFSSVKTAFNIRAGQFPFLLFSVLALFFLLVSCGKKEPPRLPVYEKPPAPSSLSAVHREAEIILSWHYPEESISSIAGFLVMKSTDGDFEDIAFVKEQSYIDKDFKTGLSYKYKVIAKSLNGLISGDSDIIEVRPLESPSPPENAGFQIMTDSVRIFWTHPAEGVLFNVYKTGKKGSYSMKPVNSSPLKEMFFIDKPDLRKDVYYTIRALWGGTVRDESYPSEEIKISPDDFVPSEPAGLEAVVTDYGIVLMWGENPEAWVRGYRVYRAEEGKGFKPIGMSQTPAFTDREKLSGKRAYKVSAVGPVKEGLLSEPLTVTPE